mmetsp:Transcript_44566/g.69717  ORF Transcript_44566/g.69717 Transcript_44566/m.69717 type:complete len:81 (+) Transcript_44566:193-435(+)
MAPRGPGDLQDQKVTQACEDGRGRKGLWEASGRLAASEAKVPEARGVPGGRRDCLEPEAFQGPQGWQVLTGRMASRDPRG